MQAVYFLWEALALLGEDESQTHSAIQPCRGAAERSEPAIKSLMRSSSITLPSQQELEELLARQKGKGERGTGGGTLAQGIKETPEN